MSPKPSPNSIQTQPGADSLRELRLLRATSTHSNGRIGVAPGGLDFERIDVDAPARAARRRRAAHREQRTPDEPMQRRALRAAKQELRAILAAFALHREWRGAEHCDGGSLACALLRVRDDAHLLEEGERRVAARGLGVPQREMRERRPRRLAAL